MNYERRSAVNRTREFLLEMLNDLSVPQEIRDNAYRCLKHYPSEYDMEQAAEQAPDIFGVWKNDSEGCV
jgi:uncharacterized protein (UPF0147 family)